MDPVNAFVDAGSAVVESAPTGPLAGLSLAVKDIFDVKGLRTGAGNPIRAANTPVATSTASAVEMLLNAGACFAGKTQTDELAYSLLGNNRHYPRPVNTAAPGRFTGGSSSGSAAAVAAGLADIACGSDTAGSIRAPASFCGLIGLRTTFGAISLGGATPLAPSFDTFGWFARDLATYQRVAQVLLPASRPVQFRRLFRCPVLDEMVVDLDAFNRFAASIELHFGAARRLDLPFSALSLSGAFRVLQAFEAWQCHGDWVRDHWDEMNKDVAERFRFASKLSIDDYNVAKKTREEFSNYIADTLRNDGVLCMPTVPGVSPQCSITAAELDEFRTSALKMLCWAPLAGLPQLHLPLGKIEQSPWGVSLLCPPGSEHSLLDFAATILRTPAQQQRLQARDGMA